MVKESKQLDQTKKLMAALVRMPPKPHEEIMKVGKPKREASEPAPRPSSRQKVGKNRSSSKAGG